MKNQQTERKQSAVSVGPDDIVLHAPIAGMVHRIVIMGGSLSPGNAKPSAEFNVYVNPEAARVVFHLEIPITMVGLDITDSALLKWDHIRALDPAALR